MMNIHTLEQAKKLARNLEKALSRKGVELAHGKTLDVLAMAAGHIDWNSFSTVLSQEGIDKQLNPYELEAARNSEGDCYGREAMVVAHNGFQLRYSDETEMCEYVRVCDPLGREIAYWDNQEWAEDPQLVMGAMLGALVRGKPMPVELVSRKHKAVLVEAVPRIQDVDFDAAFCLLVDGQRQDIVWRETEALEFVRNPETVPLGGREGRLGRDGALLLDALSLSIRDDDGFETQFSMSVGELLSLKWDTGMDAFVTPEGQSFEFYFEQTAKSWFKQHGRASGKPETAVTATAAAVEVSTLVVEETPETLTLFQVLGILEKAGAQDVTLFAKTAATSEVRAIARVRKLYETAGYKLVQEIARPCADSNAGPFSVYVDGGLYDSVLYLKDALNLAEVLLETASDEVSIECKDSFDIWTIKAIDV